MLSSYYFSSILAHEFMKRALANYFSMKLGNPNLPSTTLFDLFVGVLTEEIYIIKLEKGIDFSLNLYRKVSYTLILSWRSITHLCYLKVN